jgi:hypothetical protein
MEVGCTVRADSFLSGYSSTHLLGIYKDISDFRFPHQISFHEYLCYNFSTLI